VSHKVQSQLLTPVSGLQRRGCRSRRQNGLSVTPVGDPVLIGVVDLHLRARGSRREAFRRIRPVGRVVRRRGVLRPVSRPGSPTGLAARCWRQGSPYTVVRMHLMEGGGIEEPDGVDQEVG